MSPLPSSKSVQTPYESLGSVLDTVSTSLEQRDGTPTSLVYATTPILRDTSQLISRIVNGHINHTVWLVVLLVFSMILYYVFVVIQVDEEIV